MYSHVCTHTHGAACLHAQANEQARGGGAKTQSPALCTYPLCTHGRARTHAHPNGQHTVQSTAGRQTPGLRSHSAAAGLEPRPHPRAGVHSRGKVTDFAGRWDPGMHSRGSAEPEESQLPGEAEATGCQAGVLTSPRHTGDRYRLQHHSRCLRTGRPRSLKGNSAAPKLNSGSHFWWLCSSSQGSCHCSKA